MTEQAKATPPTQDHPYPPPTIVPYPHQAYNGPYPPPGPPGAYMPPFFAYPPPPDGSHPEGAQNGGPPAPYMIGLPPGVVYAYPPHPQAQHTPPANTSTTPALLRPKRKQVKMACTNCAGACKRCDESRPCERCVKYGIADSCIDGQRKERKKGIKRGPYKRKAKGEGEASFNGDWPNGTPPSTTPSAAAIHGVTQYAPEGYYPVYYPPPGFMPHPHDGQPGPDGSPPHPNGQPIMPYYIHPGSYPPFPHYPPMYPGAPPPGTHPSAPPASQAGQAPPEQPQTVNPSDTGRKDDSAPPAERNGVEAVGATKKRSRASKTGEPKTKKTKTAVNVVDPVLTAAAAPTLVEKKESEAAAQAAAGDGDEHEDDDASGDGDKSA